MTSPLSTFFTELARRWVAITPPDDASGAVYAEATAGTLGGASAHRTWTWESRLERATISEQAGGSYTTRYRVFAALRLHRLEREVSVWLAAIADETELLLAAWSLDATPWSSDGSIREVFFRTLSITTNADEARCTLTIEVEIQRGGT